MDESISLQVVRTIGTPFSSPGGAVAEPTRESYENARENRVALAYLEALAQAGAAGGFEEETARYRERWRDTQSVVSGVCRTLNRLERLDYVVFKSLKPYKATPNDTDILFLGDRRSYERAIAAVEAAGFLHLEDAPLQRTFYDPRGKGKVHSDKRGGVYYLDLYEKAGADYFVYLDSAKLRPFVTSVAVDGVTAPVLRAPVELAACLIHTVFPERTYQLQDFLLTLHALAGMNESDVALFVDFVRDNHITRAVSGSLTLTAALHEAAFSTIPEVLLGLLRALGEERRERELFERESFRTPHDFSVALFARTLFERLNEGTSRRSLGVQILHCLNPAFGFKAVERLVSRCRPGGIYKAR